MTENNEHNGNDDDAERHETGTGTGDTMDMRSVPDEQSGRHPLNVAHLVMGIAFLGFVAIWGAIAGDVVQSDDVRWLLPVPWVLAGAAGLLAIAFGGRRSRGAEGR